MAKETVDVEKALLRKVLSVPTNSPPSVEQLCTRFAPMIIALARDLSWDTDSFDELYQEGSLAFLRALKAFDPSAGTRLSTFLYGRIRGQMLHWRRTERKALTLSPLGHAVPVVSLDEPLTQLGDDGDNVFCWNDVIADDSPSARLFDRAHASLLSGLVGRALSALTPRKAEALHLLFWDDTGHSEIANRLGVSRPRVTVLVK